MSAGVSSGLDIDIDAHRERRLRSIVGSLPVGTREARTFHTAELVPEPDHPGNPGAVSVRIGGSTVGYIPADVAAELAPAVIALVTRGAVPTVRATIRTRQAADGGSPRSTVRLALTPASVASVIPENDPPGEPYTVLPRGTGTLVAGDAVQAGPIVAYLPASGAANLLVTLHAGGDGRPPVGVVLDGFRVGELPPDAARRTLPLLLAQTRRGLLTAAWATLEGTCATLRLSVSVPEPEAVDRGWLDGPPCTVPTNPGHERLPLPPAYRPHGGEL
ncbi:hypothetical protein F6J84_00815 [Microbacterium caowuchunii]|uniref:hypothetical protein n=1 Tax=Microbacterium caowuchunii TaxID=2614638 RepID=UPI0012490295|nr:hypothetical protein [Microbacterium caowuchunii]QEV98800.1 hypothetical protein F6J84_00815 [Microbacterium caowuchunii]